MSPTISLDRHHLKYRKGPRELVLSVEWSGVAKTADCPIDFEVQLDAEPRWTTLAGEVIPAAEWGAILDSIADYYANGPVADIVAHDGSLLRGASAYRFYLQPHPRLSHYHEVGRTLHVPMARPVHGAREWSQRYVADFSGITSWTNPIAPLDPAHLRVIAERVVRQERIGVVGIPLK